jgi:hypothetical protein
MEMESLVPINVFDLSAHDKRWFHWDEVAACFWPGQGKRSSAVNADLAQIKEAAGIYCIAWAPDSGEPTPADQAVQYIGQTKSFKNRMSQFATSAGIFWDERYSGHSAAWRWPQGKVEKMMIAFFPIPEIDTDHMQTGLLFWYEALAINAYYLKHGNNLPPLNVVRPPTALEFN